MPCNIHCVCCTWIRTHPLAPLLLRWRNHTAVMTSLYLFQILLVTHELLQVSLVSFSWFLFPINGFSVSDSNLINLNGHSCWIQLLVSYFFIHICDLGESAIASYIYSFAADLFDGMAARKFNQCSTFGGLLDMVTDRCSTLGLLFILYGEYGAAGNTYFGLFRLVSFRWDGEINLNST